jgi:hypothetical protein
MQATQRFRQFDDATLPTATLRAEPNPIVPPAGEELGVTDLHWTVVGCTAAEIRLGAPDGPLFASVEYGAGSPTHQVRTTGPWVSDGMTFFLQDVSDGQALTEEHTLATVAVRVVHSEPPPPRVPSHGESLSSTR